MNKVLTILSVVMNAALIAALIMSAISSGKEFGEYQNGIKTAAKVGFTAGCMTAISNAMRLEPGDAEVQLYSEWCTKNANSFAGKVEFK